MGQEKPGNETGKAWNGAGKAWEWGREGLGMRQERPGNETGVGLGMRLFLLIEVE